MLNSEQQQRETNQQQQQLTPVTLFTPRQVILSNSSSAASSSLLVKPKMKKSNLTSENRALLNQSICHFLQLNGFTKSLKKFHKEALVEKDSWKNCLLDLEEMCQVYLQQRSSVADTPKDDSSLKAVEKTKENGALADVGKKSEAMLENGSVNGGDLKSKKKKKSAAVCDSLNQTNEQNQMKNSEVEDVVSAPTKEKEKKKKKKHQDELEADGVVEEDKKDGTETGKKSKDKKKKHKDEMNNDLQEKQAELAGGEEKKTLKKRKKSSSENSEADHIEDASLNDSKRRKTDNSDQSKGNEQPAETFEDSAEPTTASKAFKRVKPEEVEFADERLQNNSYWAKDGADSGYGAKAQEVLGQVRGRDFRHEKTKKKRGSYRGGQIDLQSHSVKFQYDEEDE